MGEQRPLNNCDKHTSSIVAIEIGLASQYLLATNRLKKPYEAEHRVGLMCRSISLHRSSEEAVSSIDICHLKSGGILGRLQEYRIKLYIPTKLLSVRSEQP